MNTLLKIPSRIFSAALCFFLFPFCLSTQWIQATSNTQNNINTLEVVTKDTIYAAGSDFLLSTNGGQNWTVIPFVNTSNQAINGLEINDLHFFNSKVGIAVGSRISTLHVILRTTDGGAHWSILLNASVPANWPGGISELSFVNNTTGWCVGASGKVRKTVDAGLTWTNLPDLSDLAYLHTVFFTTPQTGYVSGEYSWGGGSFLKTTNGGQSWTPVVNGAVFRESFFVNSDTGFIAEQEFAHRINDGDLNWNLLQIPDKATVRDFAFKNANNGFILADNSVRKTADGGQFWLESVLPGNTAEMTAFDWSADYQTGVAVGKSGHIYRTSNGGQAGTPMAYFSFEPAEVFHCANTPIQVNNPAPDTYASSWYVDGQFYSNANDISLNFSEYGSSHTVQLVLSDGISSDIFEQTIQIAPSQEFDLGQVEWISQLPTCDGSSLQLQVLTPAEQQTYFVSVDGVVVTQELALNHTMPLVFTLPPISDTAQVRVFALRANHCESVEKEAFLTATVVPFADRTLDWSITETVCGQSPAEVVIHNSGPEIRYLLMFEDIFPQSDTLQGNGGDLVFSSIPLPYSGNFFIAAFNALGCRTVLYTSRQVHRDFVFSALDTLHTYGMAGEAIRISNLISNLASVQWNFGNGASPATSTELEPVVTYSQSGFFPYNYQYQSQLVCMGEYNGVFEIYNPALEAPGMDCTQQVLAQLSGPAYNILSVATDADGNFIVSGAFDQEWFFLSSMNLFVNKYDRDGTLLWSKKTNPGDAGNSANYRSTYGNSVTTDPDGNIYLAGSFSATTVKILGQTFQTPANFTSGYGQGFVMKLSPAGNVLWKIPFQALEDYQYCVPSNILYHDGKLHLMLKAAKWQAVHPDGNQTANGSDSSAAWYIQLDPDGNFVKDLAIEESTPNVLQGIWHPELNGIHAGLVTFLSPRLKKGLDNKLIVNGVFYGNGNLNFGTNTVAALAPQLGKNQFLATLDPESAQWTRAFCAYGLGTSAHAVNLPAWEVDDEGASWFGFGFENGSIDDPTLAVAIGGSYTSADRVHDYFIRLDSVGNLLWLNKTTEQHVAGLLKNTDGSIWALSRYRRMVGFQNTDLTMTGHAAVGEYDMLLSRISQDGVVTGVHNFGTPQNDMPLAFFSGTPGLLSFISADNHDFFGTPQEPLTLHHWSTGADCPLVAVQEPQAGLSCSVSPNPFSDRIDIRFGENVAGPISCRLRTLTGQLIFTKEFSDVSSGQISLNTAASLPAGCYLLEIQTAERVFSRKVVKGK